MLSKGAARRQGRHSTSIPCKRRVRCNVTLDVALPSYVNTVSRIAQQMEDEVVVEGLMHVTTVQAGSCMERYGDLQSMQKTAPPPASLPNALLKANSRNNRLLNEAFCLAMPPDNPTEDQRSMGYIVRQVHRRTDVRLSVVRELEEVVDIEAQACRHTAIYNLYTQELLQASTSIRRQRRRALVRAVRASRDKTKAILQGSAAALASLVSWDGDEDKERA